MWIRSSCHLELQSSEEVIMKTTHMAVARSQFLAGGWTGASVTPHMTYHTPPPDPHMFTFVPRAKYVSFNTKSPQFSARYSINLKSKISSKLFKSDMGETLDMIHPKAKFSPFVGL